MIKKSNLIINTSQILRMGYKAILKNMLCAGDVIVTVNDWLITAMDRPHVSNKFSRN